MFRLGVLAVVRPPNFRGESDGKSVEAVEASERPP